MTVSADQLRDLMVEMSALEKRIDKLVDHPIPLVHAVNQDAGTSATFIAPDMTPQQPAWVNGGPDFWCCGVGYEVFYNTSVGQYAQKLVDTGNGLGIPLLYSVQTHPVQLFDFRWNMVKQNNKFGTVSSYLGGPGGVDSLMSRQSLGNQQTGRILRFKPWRIERGNSVVFTIKPTGYDWGVGPIFSNDSDTNRFTVAMTLIGVQDQAGTFSEGGGGK